MNAVTMCCRHCGTNDDTHSNGCPNGPCSECGRGPTLDMIDPVATPAKGCTFADGVEALERIVALGRFVQPNGNPPRYNKSAEIARDALNRIKHSLPDAFRKYLEQAIRHARYTPDALDPAAADILKNVLDKYNTAGGTFSQGIEAAAKVADAMAGEKLAKSDELRVSKDPIDVEYSVAFHRQHGTAKAIAAAIRALQPGAGRE